MMMVGYECQNSRLFLLMMIIMIQVSYIDIYYNICTTLLHIKILAFLLVSL